MCIIIDALGSRTRFNILSLAQIYMSLTQPYSKILNNCCSCIIKLIVLNVATLWTIDILFQINITLLTCSSSL